MTTWQTILIPVGLIIVGIIRQKLILREKTARLDLITEFLSKFAEWYNGRAEDRSLYHWLLNKSEKVQLMLGASGLADICQPFENEYHRNVPIILNGIPAIQRECHDSWGDVDQAASYAQTINEGLRRFIGITEEDCHHEHTRLFKPLVLLCGGVAWLMELPLFILTETKVITASRRAIILNSRPFSLVTGWLK